MKITIPSGFFLILFLIVNLFSPLAVETGQCDQWLQWGGVSRDFKTNSTELADQWSEDGPRQLWNRELGDGYSAIVVDSDKLYTMYRQGKDEIVTAMQIETGQTVWEHRYQAEPDPGQSKQYGQGPNATPLILDDRVITIGFNGMMRCLDSESGELLWSHDLVKEFKGKVQFYGYANSPLAYNGLIITLVGGDDYGVAALAPDDGSIVWKSKPTEISYAAPVLINVDGQDQMVFFSPTKVIGMDPNNGSFLWDHPVINFCRVNCTSVIWGQDNLLWVATKGVGGTRVLKLTQNEGKTEVEEVWLNRKIKVFHWNAIRIGDYVYTSNGPMSVIDIKSGEIVDRHRGFGNMNGVYADGRLILLDDKGKLVLANVSAGKIEIVSSAKLLNSVAWTPPTLVGKTLYIRDRQNIMALDLGNKTKDKVF